MERQLADLEKMFIQPLEQIAFSDAPLFEKADSKAPIQEEIDDEEKLILSGANSTLSKTKNMRTAEIVRNFNVAPFYYSVALLGRWFSKASYPSVYVISGYKGLASVIKTRGARFNKRNGQPSYEEYLKDAEAMQSGWKRTGEIATLGPLSRQVAILRRSAEIWAYFSSFYLKDRRICKKFEAGKWSEKKFKAERSKLGAEVTQNLLRLGPTFIKVRIY
jgi:hypothetical protein